MNQKDRKQLTKVLDLITDVRLKLAEAQEVARALADAEQEKFDSMSEGLQQSVTGYNIERSAEQLEEFASELEDLLERVESAENTEID